MPSARLLAVLPLCVAPVVSADVVEYAFSVRPVPSSVAASVNASGTLAGTLIGDYDELKNPGGTRTIPGIFGPTGGNFPIDFSGSVGLEGDDATDPTGGFVLAFDAETGVASVSGLELDLTGDDALSVVLALTIEYDSFRTRQPTAVFLGGIPITIPFGVFELSSLRLTQTGLPGPGLVEPMGKGVYRVSILAPVELEGSLESIAGDPIAIGPLPVPLPLVFEVTPMGASATAVLSFEQGFEQSIPLEVELPADQALDLPTILPPGETAHLLVNASISSFDIAITLGATIDALGELRVFSRADWNRDGVVNSTDYFLFVVEFMTLGVDFNADGRSNSQDYFDYLDVYFSER